MKKQNGFTYIELLISVSLISIIIVAVYAAFHTGMATYRTADSRLAPYQTASVLFSLMEADIQNAYAFGKEESKFRGDTQDMSFYAVRPVYSAKGTVQSEAVFLRYTATDSSLLRSCVGGVNAFDEGSEQEGRPVSSLVKKVVLQYAASASNEARYQWQPFWPDENKAEQKKSLPLAVKVEMTLQQPASRKGEQARSIVVTRIIPIPSA